MIECMKNMAKRPVWTVDSGKEVAGRLRPGQHYICES